MFNAPPGEESLPPPSTRLESLRGLAAIQVAMFHSLSVMADYPCNEAFMAPALVLFNGRSAVSLFFVLSGFVLGLSLRRSKGTFEEIYLRYAIRRGFRIYPTVLVSTVVIAIFVGMWKSPPLTQSAFIDHWIPRSITVSSAVKQLFFIQFINPVTWSLRAELLCSLLLPLALLVERWRPRLLPLILMSLTVLAFLLPTTITVVVMPAFFLGFLLPATHGWWQRVRFDSLLNALILLLGIGILLMPRSFPWQLPTVTLLEAVGAFLIIGTIVYGADLSVFKMLDHHLIKTAGRVSYSYYVYHPLCLYSVSHIGLPLFSGRLIYAYALPAAFLLWVLSSALAFPLAWLSYTRIEKPFILYAKTLYGRADSQKPA